MKNVAMIAALAGLMALTLSASVHEALEPALKGLEATWGIFLSAEFTDH